MPIIPETATVYRAPTAGRRYLSLHGAINAEAVAIIRKKYPDEKAEYEDGHLTYPGSHWSGLPNADKMLRRMARIVRASVKSNKEPTT